jgi:protein-tyrosine-phosphatase/predicted ATP-grasp superfamily ATP-dependent carboligase
MRAPGRKSLRILVTDAHSRAGLGAVRSLGRAGHTVIAGYPAGSDRPPALVSRHCAEGRRYPIPDLTQDEFQAWVRQQARGGDIDVVLPVTEASLVGVAAIRKELPGEVLAIVPGDRALAHTLSKFHATRLALAIGIPCPETIFVSEGDAIGDCRRSLAGLRFPIIVKTDNYVTDEGGYKSGRNFVAANADQAAKILENLEHLKTPVIAQRLVPGYGTGACLLRFHGKTYLRFVHRRLHEVPYTGGWSSFREGVWDDELVYLGEKLLDAIDYDGVAMVEFRRDAVDGRPRFLEINGRLWGSLALALHCGVDFPAALIDCYHDASPISAQPRYRAGVKCRNVFPGELGHVASILMPARGSERRMSPASRLRALVEFGVLFLDPRIRHDYFWLSDPLPGLHQALKMILWVTGKALGRAGARYREYQRRNRLRRFRAEHEARSADVRYFEPKLRRVLFLCYGNICRSPFAAAYWNAGCGESLPPTPAAASAGFHRQADRSTPAWVIDAARERGIDLSEHRSKVVSRSAVDSADAIFVMDLETYQRLVSEFPSVKRKAYLLALFADNGEGEIADPYSGGKPAARACYERLVSALDGLKKRVLSG